MASRSEADERRRAIVARAAELYDEGGYHAVSVAQTAEAVGLSKAALYHYFPSKEAILFAIHDSFIREVLESAPPRVGTMSPRDELAAIVHDITRLLETHRGHVRVFLEHHRELSLESQQAMNEKRRAYARIVEDVMRRGIEAGELRPLDPVMMRRSLFGVCAWTVQWYDPATSPPTDVIADGIVDLLFRGIRGADPAPAGDGRAAAQRRRAA